MKVFPPPALLLAAFLLTSAAPPPARAAEPVVVDIRTFAFAAADITIAPGTTVEWINHDQTPHNIVSADGLFVSPGLDTDDHYVFTFSREGDYAYYCALHPFMKGVVHVRRVGR